MPLMYEVDDLPDQADHLGVGVAADYGIISSDVAL
jgi:hypothetical protein